MRLLIFSSEFPPGPGGIGTHAMKSLGSFRNRTGMFPLFAAGLRLKEEVVAFNRSQPFPIVQLNSPAIAPLKAAQRWLVKKRWIKEWQPDVILASGQRAVWLAASLSHRLPWVAVGHGTEFGSSIGWAKKIARWSFQQATSVVCVSQYTRQQMFAVGIRQRSSA
ncbi:MAG: glycosyltransferase [Pyrinomonadaceae bacterium]